MDNTRYINTETWEITDDIPGFIPVDKHIAKTIMTLNKKGYLTKASCGGHADIKFLDIDDCDIKYLEEFQNDPRAIVKEIRSDGFDYWTEIFGTSIYILFKEQYDFPDIPEGFYLEEGEIIRSNLDYYDENLNRFDTTVIKERIDEKNKILYKWAKELPDIKEG